MTGRKLLVVFVHLKKVFDHVPRKVIWLALKKKSVMEREVFAITEICKNV